MEMDMPHKNLKYLDKVVIVNLPNNALLNGAEGVIFGKSVKGVIDYYIIAFEDPYLEEKGEEFQAVSIPETNIERI